MKDVKSFLKIKRQKSEYRAVCERVKDFGEVAVLPPDEQASEQASRCMDCGTPFCHWACPVGNYIPEWNDLYSHGHWERALELLCACNNFPEFTGRLCPALCEYSCVLGLNDDAVTVRENELAIIEHAFRAGLIKPNPPKSRTGKKVAVVGSGPSGLACADQLNRAGHNVVVFERDDKVGGILRYGIPDFKLDKAIIDRRLDIFKKEGIEFKTGVDVGVAYPSAKLLKEFDAVALAGGSRVPRDLKIEGRELSGIHFAMDYLIQNNKRVAGVTIPKDKEMPNADIRERNSSASRSVSQEVSTFGIFAQDKRVLVIGGGDTGADCVGTAHRQGASCVVQIEVLPKPPECRDNSCLWPRYPLLLKTSTSHEEGGERHWSILTKKFIGEPRKDPSDPRGSKVKKLQCVRVEFEGRQMKEIPGSEFEIEADLVILAVGFIHPEHKGLVSDLKLELDPRGNVKTDDKYATSQKGVFSCGDMHRGQSLIVWAISEGRTSAYHIDTYLMGKSNLPII